MGLPIHASVAQTAEHSPCKGERGSAILPLKLQYRDIMAFVTKITPVSKKSGYFYENREIALHKAPGNPTKRRTHNFNWWPEDKKLEAATLWAVTRNLDQVKELSGIPVAHLKKMMNEPWWDEIVRKVRKEKNEVLDAKITDMLEQTMDLVIDRIQRGEYQYDKKSGEFVRIPMKARDAAVSAAILFDKRQLIRGEATSRTESVSPDEKLNQLAENFKRLAQSKGINPEGEVIDGVQNENEAETKETEVL